MPVTPALRKIETGGLLVATSLVKKHRLQVQQQNVSQDHSCSLPLFLNVIPKLIPNSLCSIITTVVVVVIIIMCMGVLHIYL